MANKILLADDSAPAKNLGKKILEDAGYQVVACSNGLEARRKMAEGAFDLAILDIFMPGYTGLELCSGLRANPATASLPVILTVGKHEPYRDEESEQVRANAVLIKPYADEDLVAAVRKLIGAPPAAGGNPLGALGAPRRSRPLLEWWDPAAHAIERSIAAAQQLRRGMTPPATPPTRGTTAAMPTEAAPEARTDIAPTMEKASAEALAPEPLGRDPFGPDPFVEDLGDYSASASAEAAVEEPAAEDAANPLAGLEYPFAEPFSAPAPEVAPDAPESHEAFAPELCAVPPAGEAGENNHAKSRMEDEGGEEFAVSEPEPPGQRADACEILPVEDVIAPAQVEISTTAASGLAQTPAIGEDTPMGEAERIRQVVEAVFERFRPMLVDAVLRELGRKD